GTLKTRLRGHMDLVRSASVSADGKFLLTASADGTARLWDLHSLKTLAILPTGQGPATRAVFSPTNTAVLVIGEDATPRIYSCKLCGSLNDLTSLARDLLKARNDRLKSQTR